MKVLIEELSTGLFYKTSTEWVQSKARARAFRDLETAIRFCLGRTMPDVRLLVSFENAEHDFYLQPFGQNELADKTQRLVLRNRQLQEQQWALSSQVETAVAELRKTRNALADMGSETVASQVQSGQSAA